MVNLLDILEMGVHPKPMTVASTARFIKACRLSIVLRLIFGCKLFIIPSSSDNIYEEFRISEIRIFAQSARQVYGLRLVGKTCKNEALWQAI